MEPVIEVVEEKLLAAAVADEIIASVNDSLEEQPRCSLVLSGGRTPGAIFRTLSRPPRVSEIEWDKVHIYWGDERWVDSEDDQSNFKMARETLLTNLTSPAPTYTHVDTSASSPQKGAENYAAEIKKIEGLNNGETPSFDIVLLGLGTDGHVASLFPDSDTNGKAGEICLAVSPLSVEGTRVSLSADALFSAKKIMFIVRGESKAEIVKRVIEGDDSPDVLPARHFTDAKGRVTWFLDSAAASLLENR